jgi:hypothetical protein
MAEIPKGPGQQEKTGMGKDARDPEPVGTYKDPESGAEATVVMPAGADALVHMGWKLIKPLEK